MNFFTIAPDVTPQSPIISSTLAATVELAAVDGSALFLSNQFHELVQSRLPVFPPGSSSLLSPSKSLLMKPSFSSINY